MLTCYVLGRKINRGKRQTFKGENTTAAAAGAGLAEVVYGMVRARKRKTGRRGEILFLRHSYL